MPDTFIINVFDDKGKATELLNTLARQGYDASIRGPLQRVTGNRHVDPEGALFAAISGDGLFVVCASNKV